MAKRNAMGKAARNEIRKIRAAYLNNIAVGAFIAGFFIPYVAYTAKMIQLHGFFWIGTFNDWIEGVIVIAPALLAFLLSRIFHSRALRALEQIED
jgi:hypothetical protein